MDVLIDIAFWALGVVAILSGGAVFWVDSMARASYALALSFVAVGVQVLFLQQNYVGIIVILMMIMEMAIMAVYMVMFMGMNPALMPMSMVHSKKTALGIATAVFAMLAAGILLTEWPSRRGQPSPDVTASLGEALMSTKMLVMVVVSPIMIATIVSGVVLAAHRTRYDRLGDDLRGRPADDPQGGGVGQ